MDEYIPADLKLLFEFKNLNEVQKPICREIFRTNNSLVVTAPTGSGKTVLFELAIVKHLSKLQSNNKENEVYILYIGPLKSICSQVFSSWQQKFAQFSLNCIKITGDSDIIDLQNLNENAIIVATPEKINSMIKISEAYLPKLKQIHYCFIDEIHMLGDPERGAALETLITKLKILADPRFICVSATLSNVQDVAHWLSSPNRTVSFYSFGEEFRQTKIRKIVLGYPHSRKQSIFKFDSNLSYKIPYIIDNYSCNKPVLIFCTTRRGTIQTANDLSKLISLLISEDVISKRHQFAESLYDQKLKECVLKGIGYHHAGVDAHDRNILEEAFLAGCLPVITCTSTLAMGVNLPAHLVIIKNTENVIGGQVIGYSSTQILQMIGRAGRPQFDNEGVAIIMTTTDMKSYYDGLIHRSDVIESCLLADLTNHLFGEIGIGIIKSVNDAKKWLKNTFFCVRMQKSPQMYGLSSKVGPDTLEGYIHGICLNEIENLEHLQLVNYDLNAQTISISAFGELVLKSNLRTDTVKMMFELSGTEETKELLHFIACSAELREISLRNSEKTLLNKINRTKGRNSLRFPLTGRIKTVPMKITCLLQAQLNQTNIDDYSIKQDIQQIICAAQRITNALVGLLRLHKTSEDNPVIQSINNLLTIPSCEDNINQNQSFEVKNNSNIEIPKVAFHYKCMLNALELRKSIQYGRWLNSPLFNLYRSSLLSNDDIDKLICANFLTSDQIEKTDPIKLEMILNKPSPFGKRLLELLKSFPKYNLDVEQLYYADSDIIKLKFVITSTNAFSTDTAIILVGNMNNELLARWYVESSELKDSEFVKIVTLTTNRISDHILVSLISLNYANTDIKTQFPINRSVQNQFEKSINTQTLDKNYGTPKNISIGYFDNGISSSVITTKETSNRSLWSKSPLINTEPAYDLNKPVTVHKTFESFHKKNQNNFRNKRKFDVNRIKDCLHSNRNNQVTFTWTPTTENTTPKTPLVQTSMLEYLKKHNTLSEPISQNFDQLGSTTLKYKPHTFQNTQHYGCKPSRKRFKWNQFSDGYLEQNRKKILDSNSYFIGSTFSLTPVFHEEDTLSVRELNKLSTSFQEINPIDDFSFSSTVNNCMNKTYPNVQFNGQNIDPASFNLDSPCVSECNSFVRTSKVPTKDLLKSGTFCNESEQHLNNQANYGELTTPQQNEATPTNVLTLYTDQARFSDYVPWNTDHDKPMSCTPTTSQHGHFVHGMDSDNNDSSVKTTEVALNTVQQRTSTPKFEIPRFSVVLKSYRHEKSKSFINPVSSKIQKKNDLETTSTSINSTDLTSRVTNRRFQNRFHGYSETTTINTGNQDHMRNLLISDESMHSPSEQTAIDLDLVHDGWPELACLIKITELGLLQDMNDSFNAIQTLPKVGNTVSVDLKSSQVISDSQTNETNIVTAKQIESDLEPSSYQTPRNIVEE